MTDRTTKGRVISTCPSSIPARVPARLNRDSISNSPIPSNTRGTYSGASSTVSISVPRLGRSRTRA